MTEEKDLKKQIIEEIKRIAKEQNLETIKLSDFRNNSDISVGKIYKYFSWREAVEAAGLKPDATRRKKSEDELWEEFFRMCVEIDGIPNTMKFKRVSRFSMHDYTRRFGNHWDDILFCFKEWLKEKHPDSKFIDLLQDKSKIQSTITQPKDNEHYDFVWQSRKKGVVYGSPINFRGLRHAPVNEQGVVFLFGKISEELGFSIEAIRTDYPDCEGKRLVDKNKNLWEPVSIEFEYRSINFKQYAHDASKCDVIICWIHDWLDCPLEVIELREVIERLKK